MAYLCSYLPQAILSFLVNQEETLQAPLRNSYETVVLFADVSGFTAMCEAMADTGPGGDENLAKNLNSYFELLVRAMGTQGGDVFKFAGDAILVIWPPSSEDLSMLTRRAAQCALEMGELLQDAVLSHGVRLSVKVGIGAGKIAILQMGGEYNRMEYLAVGDPLIQAFHAEHQATKRDVVVSPEAWALIKDFFEAEVMESGHAFVSVCKEKLRKANIIKNLEHYKNLSDKVIRNIAMYIPTAVVPFAYQQDDKWISELRHITVLFVNLGLSEHDLISISNDEDMRRVDTVLRSVQKAVYQYEGSLNKFLMDDKGSTLIAIFGLPPLAHQDDAIRGVLAALSICSALHQLDLRPSVGITTGTAFCGVVGSSRGRREYSVLGDTVNLSARLMQHATISGAGVLCDTATQAAALQHASLWHQLSFYPIAEINVKGKSKPIDIWQPIVKKQNPPHLLNQIFAKRLKQVQAGKHASAISPQGRRSSFTGSVPPGISTTGTGTVSSMMAATEKANATFNQVVAPYIPQAPAFRTLQEIPVDVEMDSELASHQNALYRLLTGHIALCLADKRAEKHTAIIESDVGLGKSTLLLNVISKIIPEVEAEKENFPIVFGAGNKFDVFTPLRCWRDVMLKIMHGLNIINPRQWVRDKISLKKGGDEVVAVLNDVFEWQFEGEDRITHMDRATRLTHAEKLVVSLLEILAQQRRGALIICIEEATYLDLHSWTVALAVSQLVPKIMMLLLTRPMDKTYMSAFMPPDQIPPQAYKQLKNEPQTDVLHIRPRGAQVITHIVSRMLDVETLPPELIELVLDKARGNPWVAGELVGKLVADNLVTVSSAPNTSTGGKPPTPSKHKGHKRSVIQGSASGMINVVELSPKLLKSIELAKRPYTAVARADRIALPNSIQSVNGARLDRLSLVHVMILKIGAVLGNEFDFALMKDTMSDLPLAKPQTGDSMEREFSALAVIDILRRVKVDPNSPAGATTAGTQKYMFTSGVMRDVILSRMLDNHQLALINKIRTHSDQYKVDPERSSFVRNDDHSKGDKVFQDSLMEGYLKKQGAKLKHWKARYFVLWHGKLTYYKNKNEANKGPRGEILIEADSLVESDSNSSNFLISHTSRSGEGREFQAPSKEDAEKWVEEIKKVARKINTSEQGQDKQIGERNGSFLTRGADLLSSDGLGQGKKLYSESIKEGFLCKKGESVKSLKKRYFVLFNDKLIYFEMQNVKNVKGEIPLGKDTVVEKSDVPAGGIVGLGGSAFNVISTLGARRYLITAQDDAEAQTWIDAIRKVIKQIADGSSQKMANHSVKEGTLRKKGGPLGHWKMRYFVLYNNKIQYFERNGETTAMMGEMDLFKETMAQLDSEGAPSSEGGAAIFTIKPAPDSKTYTLEAKDQKEALAWVAAINSQLGQAKHWQSDKEKEGTYRPHSTSQVHAKHA